jgi:DNA modification methylase
MNEIRPISELKEWKDNPRNISKKDFERLKGQIQKLGQYKPLLITPEGEVIGGNMRIKAYRELGIKDIWVSIVEPKDENEKLEYALSDNDRAGYYDDDLLANLIPNYQIDWSQYAVDMKPPEDIQQLIDRIAPIEEDEAPEVADGEAISKLGEVYQLGRHRLMCGDSTKIEDVEKLMDGKKADMVFTDPPYGIDVVGDKGNVGGDTKQAPTTKFRKVIGDDTNFDPTFVIDYARLSFIWGGNYFADRLPKGGRWFVWDKNRPEGLSLSDCELAWSNIPGVKVQKFKVTWDGYHKEGESGTRVHPNQKPIKLLSDVLKEITNENQTILDLFGGSGSTLIACEQTNRICYMMELDPKYCDVIRKRYYKFIGKEEEWQTIIPKL